MTEMKWLGLRLNVVLEGAQGLTIDVRRKVADAATSFAARPTTGTADGQKTSRFCRKVAFSRVWKSVTH
jgi:hypothetical protein